MRKRLYFLLPDVKHAQQTLRDLLLARIEERHIHTLANENIDIKDLPEATLSQRSDVIRGMQLGLLVGAITGAVVGSVIFRFPPEGMSFPVGVILAFVLLGAVFGIWVSGMIGSGAPNSQLREFEKAIAAGKILIMVDVPREKISEVRGIMKKRHPEADDRGIEPTIPAFP